MKTLRPYQEHAIRELRKRIRAGNRRVLPPRTKLP